MIPAIAGFLCCCNHGDSGPGGPAEIGSKTLRIYGRVNEAFFMEGAPLDVVKDTLRRELEICAAEGLDGYQVEAWGWVRYSRMTPEQGMERTRVMLPFLVETCRQLDLWCFVSGANNNQHLGKYGGTPRTLTQDWRYIGEVLNILVALGPENVIVQPVCETQTDDGVLMEEWWEGVLNPLGFCLVDNHGSRPIRAQSWSKGFVYHPWNIDDAAKAPAGAWINNDTGVFISQLAKDLTMTGPSNPPLVSRYVSDAVGAGHPAVMVYAWGYSAVNGIDVDTIKAIGAAK